MFLSDSKENYEMKPISDYIFTSKTRPQIKTIQFLPLTKSHHSKNELKVSYI